MIRPINFFFPTRLSLNQTYLKKPHGINICERSPSKKSLVIWPFLLLNGTNSLLSHWEWSDSWCKSVRNSSTVKYLCTIDLSTGLQWSVNNVGFSGVLLRAFLCLLFNKSKNQIKLELVVSSSSMDFSITFVNAVTSLSDKAFVSSDTQFNYTRR